MKLAHVKVFTKFYWTCPYCNKTNDENTDTKAYDRMFCNNCQQYVLATHEENEQGEDW